ncbi:LacI family DNA-binding transcriptional regulator [Flavobacterium celericrescens]|uniref:LacI family transcriptional regulator n=1 Tax=Flavobacterium celericrescens TaxID=2709780 RepID=A0ABX0IBR2_9FLAO|nr:LacI family DNA-binding transcriptional regulator [Flavobacterium celericrescens]NHM03132.1 LacI family transcriptional regulator [Flavobacterium celericrescens]
MKAKATLKQIAKEFEVSISTVSKALSDSPEISEATKIKIQEYAKLQNYKPNSIAKNLKNQRTNTIGVIIPNILNPFFAKVFSGIEKAALAKGYNVITGISNESYEKEMQVMDMLNNGTIDGFIVSVAEETQSVKEYQHFKDIINSGTPIVMFDRVAETIVCDKVIVDDFESSYDATQHLLKLGSKKIALLSTIGNLSVGKLRFDGYQKALEENNIKLNDKLLVVENEIDLFDKKLTNLFLKEKVDAIFALDEHASTMAMKLAIKKGIKIPEQLNIIGFADGVWSKRLTPSLSTVSQHAPEIGAKAAELLINKLNTKDEFYQHQTVVIKTELRQRESTRKL